MKLREIGIKVYYEPEIYGISETNYNNREEYLRNCQKYYRDNILLSDRAFRMQTRNTSSFFSRLLYEHFKNMQYPFCKVIISCCKSEKHIGKIAELDGIAEVKVLYDYCLFADKSDDSKKRDTLDIIMRGLNCISESYGIDMKPFNEIESMIVAEDYQNKWVWKTKWDPRRTYNAKIIIEHEVNEAIIRLRIEDKNGNAVFEKALVKAKPDEWDYSFFLGKLLWKSAKEFCLLDKNNNAVGIWYDK